ncbi:hypothetical protein MMC07_003213 [Pseudocyphellaria aurata]|nr:hypothetical protein [Pseudocyphellaria aurata]
MSSGTIGGAMEAALFRKKAIALSFAFNSREHDPKLIAGACRQSAKIIEHLCEKWPQDVDLYSINVPVVDGVEERKIWYTNVLQNYWSSGSSFREVDANEDDTNPDDRELEIRQGAEVSSSGAPEPKAKPRHYVWAPKFSDLALSIEGSPAGNDGWAIKNDYSSVTPLKANFMHAPSIQLGELKLSSAKQGPSLMPVSKPSTSRFYALIDYKDTYVQPLILEALRSTLPSTSYTLIPSISSLPSPTSPFLQITSYENIEFSHLLGHPSTSFANAYIIRKALIRKHYLAHTVSAWCSKYPTSLLKDHVKQTLDFELDYAEFLDEALLEAYELHDSFARNAERSPEDPEEWWILKPGMSDSGQGIRIFSSEAQLRAIFEEWEPDPSDLDSDSESAGAQEFQSPTAPRSSTDGIITSQLRHFIVQPYIHPPLLLPSCQNRKFHLRSYVLALGALRVYVYKELLALFAPLPYTSPSASSPFDPQIHLTNTCLHNNTSSPLPPAGTVSLFSALPSSRPPSPSQPPQPPTTTTRIDPDWKPHAWTQIAAATAELFLAAARTQSTHFQPLPNAFEVFGLDWLLDAHGHAWLLEVNAFPDFAQSGGEEGDNEDGTEGRKGKGKGGKGVVRGFWNAVVRLLVAGFFGGEGGDEEQWGMTKVLDVDLGKR